MKEQQLKILESLKSAISTLLYLKQYQCSIPMGIGQFTVAPFLCLARSADLPRHGPDDNEF
jgi:hypothetical protein